ncbi:MAG: ABC transporter permease [Gemmatimonadota bacterium]|nr:ABC transporter permease [Gemmatimonadota bacterium]
MQRTPAWRRYLRFWGPNVAADVDDELRFHVDALTTELIATGMTPAAAHAEALRRFGDVARYRATLEEAGHYQERAARFSTFLQTVRQDVAYALRTLRRAPVFTAVTVVSLSLGIGANAAIFSLADAILLRPLPGIREPERLATLAPGPQTYPNYRDYRDLSTAWEGLAAFRERRVSLGLGTTARLARVAIVSGNYFSVLGTPAFRGRTILPDDDAPGAGRRVAVVSYGLWQRDFAADPAVLGRKVELNGAAFTVVGVAPPGFRGPLVVGDPSVWIPINSWPSVATGEFLQLDIESRTWGWLVVIGRLRPRVDIAGAERELDVIAERLRQLHRPTSRGPADLELRPAVQTVMGADAHRPTVRFMAVLAAVAGIALLVACANVANLQLARGAERAREIGVRLALGAGRGRLVRQLVTENLVLAALGGVVAVGVSRFMLRSASVVSLPGGVSVADLASDLSTRAVAFTFAVACTVGIAFGLLPALRASNPELVGALKDARSTSPRSGLRLRGALVASQIALCLVLLAGAGLFLRSLQQALRVDLGFRPSGVAVAEFHLGLQRYDSVRAQAFYDRLAERMRALPGVAAVGWGTSLPFGGDNVITVRPVGATFADGDVPAVAVTYVGGDFFRAVGIPIVRGRALDERDRAGAPGAAVISEAMAARLWPGQDPIGRQFNGNITVVGVARDIRFAELTGRPEPYLYGPLPQIISTLGLEPVSLAVRASGDLDRVHAAIRREVRVLDTRVPIIEQRSLDDLVAAVLLPQRIGATLLSLFGALTLVLAAVGVYGVLASVVGRRTREIGIRVALGARPAQVVAMVLRQSFAVVAGGVVAGLVLALAAAKGIASLLFGVGPTDPLTFAATAAALVAVGLAASYVPARRATRVNPTEALRHE